ncbi:MAG: DUF669 domain-containing protein [Agarilytica sp.]
MGDLSSLNMAQVEAKSFSVLPVGDYKACIVESGIYPTKANNGYYVKAKFQVLEGEHKNRIVFNNFNIANPNPAAVEMGLGQLKACAEACGVPNIQDSHELTDKICIISVGIDPKNPDQNTIKGYASAQPGPATAQQQGFSASAENVAQPKPSFM